MPKYVEIVSQSNSSVTNKGLAAYTWTVHVRYDFFYGENGYRRSDTHMIRVDVYEGGNGPGTNNSTVGDDDWGGIPDDYGSYGTVNMTVGESRTVSNPFYSLDIYYDKIRDIRWSRRDPASGLYITNKSWSSCTFQAYNAGRFKIYCYMEYGSGSTYVAYYYVNVSAPQRVNVTNIALNKTSVTISPKESFQLDPTIYPSNATDKSLTWTSDNIDVATVSSSGLIQGVGIGTVNITCRANDGSGVKTSCTVTVSLGEFSLNTPEGATLYYEITDEKAKTCELTRSSVPSSVTKVTIPSSANGYKVTSIRSMAFANCSGLTSVNIPSSVTSIGHHAFQSSSRSIICYVRNLCYEHR